MARGKKSKKAIDSFNSKLKLVMKSGRTELGYRQTLRNLRTGRAKMVILAANTSRLRKAEVEYMSMLGKCSLYHYSGNNKDLGTACGKYFRVGVMTILDEGDSDIMALNQA